MLNLKIRSRRGVSTPLVIDRILNGSGQQPPRVCILIESYSPVVGGMESQARSLAKRLKKKGFPVIVVTRRVRDGLPWVECNEDIEVRRLPPTGRVLLARWLMALFSLPILIKHRERYDIIFVPGFRVLGMPAIVVSKLCGKACILKADSNGEMSGEFFAAGLSRLGLGPSRGLAKWAISLRNKLLRKADAFVSMSSQLTTELVAEGISPAVIHVIPNAVDTDRFKPATGAEKAHLRSKLQLEQSEIIAIYTGRLVSYKGLPLLVRVWNALSKRYFNTRLLLVGGGGADMHNCEMELRGYIRNHGLADRVKFTGDVGNVEDFLRASDLFVFPTENEAFGLSLTEAMACRLPVVATRTGGILDIVVDEQNGLLVECGNFEELYAAIDRVLSDTAGARTLGEQAWRTAQQRYSEKAVVDQYIQLFRSFNDHRQ